ncbi:Protein of unknown function precursor [Flavobacterium branchiophilum FL-15]|uniref:Uncharacterized protein n=2 Tax=Flavobacterium branchiophilum TaxID=55197 RepID=G2Z4D7_FLABF|nr:hypothetical protein [Flavobacterium branchiophilum]CCB68412.1 Protein of unknown function precursor [Flavobacterium branchiophilum FL-15]
MKKIFITVLLFFAVGKITAQNGSTITAIEEHPNWPVMLSNLNQSEITAGFLYNKTAMFSNLYDFNRGNYNLSHADHAIGNKLFSIFGTKTVKLCPKFCKCVPNSVKMQNLGHFILSERYFCCQESVHQNYFENDS